ncbi:MAG: hypothetical protein M1818_005866 [Claussenomyces sp. TS43310]|nr:MAG: hypothetical protein M1818_005866 [Claussenomyces sp. TS43310]
MSSLTTRDERQPFHVYHKTSNSSSSSVVTVQRAASAGPNRSDIRQTTASSERSDIPQTTFNSPTHHSKSATSPESRRHFRNSHSRSNSIPGIKDGLANLNRWSQSTTSSKDSGAQARSNSFSRRMSFGAAARPPSDSLDNTSPSKGQRYRPAAEVSSKLAPTGRPFDSSSNPALFLPPIITLPPLQTSHDAVTPRSAATPTPSTGTLLSAAFHATVPDYFGATWEASASREPARARSPLQVKSPSGHVQLSPGSLQKWRADVSPARSQRRDERKAAERGHSRNRSRTGKSSSGTTSSERSRERKPPSQKAMLSKALEKANTAVLLDNAQNFEGAIEAYTEACNLLQQVMARSSGDEDKRKLEAIRNTYKSRIEELEKIIPDFFTNGKALPARPESQEYQSTIGSQEIEDTAIIETATVARLVDDEAYMSEARLQQASSTRLPKRGGSLPPSPYDSSQKATEQYIQHSKFGKSPIRERVTEIESLALPMNSEFMPQPLSPRRPSSTNKAWHDANTGLPKVESSASTKTTSTSPDKGHNRQPSNESVSWLDTIDESGGSATSSIHSRTSSFGMRRKHLRAASGETEAEFDAALDAAVEAAYDDGYEPAEEQQRLAIEDGYDNDLLMNVKRKVELAREMVRQTERETAIQNAHEREKIRLLQEKNERHESFMADYEDDEAEEEERMLEEMTRGFVMDDFEFDLPSKSALPRESNSSGFSGRTWNSSVGSNPTTAATSLSMVPEQAYMPGIASAKTFAAAYPPPLHASPAPPVTSAPHPPKPTLGDERSGNASTSGQGVRSRRLSGQNPKELKIETAGRPSVGLHNPLPAPPSMPPPPAPGGPSSIQPPHTAPMAPRQRQPTLDSARPPFSQFARQASSPFPVSSPSDVASPPTPTLAHTFSRDGDELPRSGSPARPQSRGGLRKNFSSTSLKNLKSRNLSMSHDDGSDASPNTPMSTAFGVSHGVREHPGRLPAMPALPTPIATSFRDKMNMNGGDMPSGGFHLFNSVLSSPGSNPDSPTETGGVGPIPLEPCPTQYLLRPFWLMRALYQTIAHPRGGYLSTKLFVPKDVWHVKGVKIKGLEEKISNCDYLTAALQKLAKVDNCDADSVLDEMQALEGVLEQVQASLAKKLGSEVGVHGSGVLFKDAPAAGEAELGSTGSRTSNSGGKSAFSWRRLRSKNSGMGLTNIYGAKSPPVTEPSKDCLTMNTLPMTSLASIRFAKRDISTVKFSGPNSHYMAALARLFDAAQVIGTPQTSSVTCSSLAESKTDEIADQVARQVEDPGLRHADKTQVGLELCTRHAAEFFGFYICRFVLNDVGLLLDKFIKRGSEWVVA